MASKKSRARKEQLAEELAEHFDNYTKLFVVEVDNVGSNQLHQIRKALRGEALIYCGKNTQMRRVIRELEADRPELEKIRNVCVTNVALVFTNNNLSDMRDLILENRKPAAAKAGAIAPVDVIVPAGNTGMEPTQTSFLQALNIPSKITKGTIEILNDVDLLKVGDKVDASQAALLAKLSIFPFSYGLVIRHVFEDGSLFSPSVLDITSEQIIGSFQAGMKNVAALSIELDMPTMVSVPFSIMRSFANLLAVSAETEYTFKQAESVKAFLADPTAFASAAPAAAASGGGDAPAAAKKPETESEDDDDGAVGGMFGDDY